MLEGEARDVAREMAGLARRVALGIGPVSPPAALVSGGETTVTVRGRGRGGRNQELALAALAALEDGMVLASVGTDGVDGTTDAAGAVADAETLRRARERGLDWCSYLEDNDSHAFFAEAGGLVFTGPTGTNVADLRVLLLGPAPVKN